MNQARENLIWIDFLRAAASFGVVLIHVAADVVTQYGKIPAGDWWIANFYDSLVRGCVPLFIMVSGALLLKPSDESIAGFFRKRAKRILIPFVFWTAAYLIWKKIFFLPDMTLADAIGRAAGNKVHFHLWFFYVLTGLYLVTPAFRVFTRHAEGRHFVYFLAVWFAVSSLIPFLQQAAALIWKINFQIKLPVEPATGFIGYFLLGYALSFAQPRFAGLARLLWGTSLAICMTGTYLVSAHTGFYNGIFYDNMAPNVVFFVAGFFLIMKNLAPFFEKLPAAVQNPVLQFSRASFGIYLVHPMIMEAVEKGRWGFTLAPGMDPPAVMILATTAAVYLLSFAAVLVLQRIPLLNKTV